MQGIYNITKTNKAIKLSLVNKLIIFSKEPYKMTIVDKNDSLEINPIIKEDVTLYGSGKLNGNQIKEIALPRIDNNEVLLSHKRKFSL